MTEIESLTVREYAKRNHLHPVTVRKMVLGGRLHAKKIATKWIIPADALPDVPYLAAGTGEEKTLTTGGKDKPPSRVAVVGVGDVLRNPVIDQLLQEKAEAVIAKEIAVIKTGMVTPEDVKAFMADVKQVEVDLSENATEKERLADLANSQDAIAEDRARFDEQYARAQADFSKIAEWLATAILAFYEQEDLQNRLRPAEYNGVPTHRLKLEDPPLEMWDLLFTDEGKFKRVDFFPRDAEVELGEVLGDEDEDEE